MISLVYVLPTNSYYIIIMIIMKLSLANPTTGATVEVAACEEIAHCYVDVGITHTLLKNEQITYTY